MKLRNIVLLLFLIWFSSAFADGVDPLLVDLNTSDALKFSVLMKNGLVPSAETLQHDYLDGAGLGVAIFTPHRIVNAQNLARAIATKPEVYRYAIRECLPLVPALRKDLRAIYLAYRGLLPERSLPPIEIIFGARNSGGTASAEAQVIGLEVTCPPGTNSEQFRTIMRGSFAHETVHTWQADATPQELADPLLSVALREGVADYLTSLVTGEVPHLDRDKWARTKESWLWQEFQGDRQAIMLDGDSLRNPMASSRFKRWFANCGFTPNGWPCEAGYWLGMRIAEAYVEHAPDKHAAIRKLLEIKDPEDILKASDYERTASIK